MENTLVHSTFPMKLWKAHNFSATPFHRTSMQLFLKKSFSLQSLFPREGNCGFVGGKWKKFLCTATANTIIITAIFHHCGLNMSEFCKNHEKMRTEGVTIKIHSCAKITMNSKCQENFWFDHFIWYDMEQLQWLPCVLGTQRQEQTRSRFPILADSHWICIAFDGKETFLLF